MQNPNRIQAESTQAEQNPAEIKPDPPEIHTKSSQILREASQTYAEPSQPTGELHRCERMPVFPIGAMWSMPHVAPGAL